MGTYRIAPRAEQDITELLERTLTEFGRDKAHRLLEEMHGLFRLLAQFNEMGRPRPELTGEHELFVFAARWYFIVYDPKATPIEVVSVLDARRNTPDEMIARAA